MLTMTGPAQHCHAASYHHSTWTAATIDRIAPPIQARAQSTDVKVISTSPQTPTSPGVTLMVPDLLSPLPPWLSWRAFCCRLPSTASTDKLRDVRGTVDVCELSPAQ